jgi:hypothetical protein
MHSFSYSPPGIPAPGWRMYAEIHLNRNAPIWPQMKELNTWIARNQFVLQSGVPVADALVYPVESNPVDGPFNLTDDQPCSAVDAIDGANAYLLAELARAGNRTRYHCKHIVLRDDIVTLTEAKHLMRLAERGMTIWCSYAMPERWQALQNADHDQVRELREFYSQATHQGQVKATCGRNWRDIVAMHRTVQTRGTGKLSFQRRRLRDAEIYFVSSWEEPFRGEVSFPYEGQVPEIWSADTGTVRRVDDSMQQGNGSSIAINLGKNESVIVVFPTTTSSRK